ncbi:hypothetical protein LZ30DRAFT_795314 [Colletotrichum cereale]|nr:hypothetical protein LZ30DRAFT_795314 [Colletotrichum cereale]
MADNAPQRQSALALPPLVKLAESRWKWKGELYDASEIPDNYVFDTELLGRIVLPNDPGSFVILSPLKRGHRSYRSEDDLSEDSYYVGIDGLFTPGFIHMSNCVVLGLGSTKKRARLIIPPVDMLRPRQYTFLKVQSLGTEYHPNDEPDFRKVSKAFLGGRRCAVLIEDSMAEPDYSVVKHMTEDNWELFRMYMPKLGHIKIPKGLVDEIKSFLVKYPQDIVPINLAVSMAIHQPELAVSKYCRPLQDGETTAKKDQPVPSVELALLILYSTHYFRIHEEHGLYAYAKIFRIIWCMYKKDKIFDAAFEINIEGIDHKIGSRYISGMEIKDEDWAEIVPPCFEGSRITMPKNYGNREPRSKELTACLMMPDIYTLGFPGYTNEWRTGHDVMMHGSWVPKHVLAVAGWLALGQEHLAANSLEPYNDQEPRQLWTAPQTEVRPPWPDMTTVDMPLPPPPPSPLPLEETLLSAAAATAAAADKSQSPSAGLVSDLVTLGSDGHLTWPGQPKRLKETPELPREIDIQKPISDAAAAAKDRVSEKDRLILRKITKEGLPSDKHVGDCLQSIRMTDANDANLSRRHVETTLAAAARPMQKALKRVYDYGSSIRAGDWEDGDFMNNLVRPCCELLGLDASGSPSECKDAIHHVERDLHEAIIHVEFVVRYQRENVESFKIAMKLVTSTPCFRYISRLMLLNMHICGTRFDGDDKKAWAAIFGEPFEDDEGGN